jgi:hypothetical protein
MHLLWALRMAVLHVSTVVICAQGDFAANLKLLQRYPPVDAHSILHRAEGLANPQKATMTAAPT